MTETRKYADRKRYLIAAVKKRRKKVKQMAIDYKGGKCQICGYNKCESALELHHNKGDKLFGISEKGYTRSWAVIKKELDKCMLLCANCHLEVEAGTTQLSVERQIEKRGEFGEAPDLSR